MNFLIHLVQNRLRLTAKRSFSTPNVSIHLPQRVVLVRAIRNVHVHLRDMANIHAYVSTKGCIFHSFLFKNLKCVVCNHSSKSINMFSVMVCT